MNQVDEEPEEFHRRKSELEWACKTIEREWEKNDLVNHPPHYTQGGIECIEVLEQLASQGHDFRVLNAIKYCWRYADKGGAESLRKAIWYLDRAAGDMEGGDEAQD